MTPLYDLSSLPSTLSTMTPPMLRSEEEKGVEDDRNHNSVAAFVSCEQGVMPSKKNIRMCEDKVCPQCFERFSYLHRYTLPRLAKHSKVIQSKYASLEFKQTQTNNGGREGGHRGRRQL